MRDYTQDVFEAVAHNSDELEQFDKSELATVLEVLADSILDADTEILFQLAAALRDFDDGV